MTLKGPGHVGLTAVDYDPFAGEALARVVPTTEPQREVWLADHLGREASLAYNESIYLKFSGALHIDALRQALQDLVQRHEALRATIGAGGEEFCIAGDMALEVPLTDCSTLAEAEQQAAIAAARLRVVETPFDLERGPLFRAEILKLAADSHMLIVTAHHIVCDGWSFGVLVGDLAALYAVRTGVSASGPGLPASFGDYAVAQGTAANGAEFAAAEAYWLSRFSATAPTLDLPLDRSRKASRTFTSRREDYVLDAGLVSDIRKLGARNGASLFAALLAGFAALLQRIAGADDLVIGIPAAGQSLDGLDSLVGHCVNLLPLRIAVSPSKTMNEIVAATQTAVLDAYDHQQYTFGTLLRKLALERDSSRLPLVSVLFNIDQELDANASGFPDVGVEFSSNPRSYENFELFINAVQVRGTLRLECQYNTDLFDGTTIRRWLTCYETLLRAACGSVDQPLGKLALVSADERNLLAQWNGTSQPLSRTALVHELFEAQAGRTPDRAAVSYQGVAATYRALDIRANRIAHSLRAKGIHRGMLVGIHVERSLDMVAAILGVLKAGAAYVPLDPSYPVERLMFMATDARLSVLVTQSPLSSSLAWPRERCLTLDAEDAQISAQPETRVPPGDSDANPEDIAYVIYTSGSTGKPKGVQVPHRAVVNFLESMAREPGLSENDKLVAVTTLSFDIAVNEILLPLAVGAEIVLAARDVAADGMLLRRLVEDSGATAMQATPATWRLLIGAGWQGGGDFRSWCGGEALGLELARQLLERTGALWNMYGPTETTVWSTCWRVEHPEHGIVIGRPIANTQVWILDEQRQLCPIGVPGEIWIGGEGVTLGYLGQPELTAERFISDPFRDGAGARLYRTGDRGRWRADGQLEHLGRLDFQVKIRGYRIELGEIEASLSTHPEVAGSVVVTREDRPGDVRLVAYIVARAGTAPADDALKAHLKKTLPEYMIPQHIVAIPAVPLLPNGKVDRKSLPAPGMAPKPANEYVAPRSDLEKSVLAAMEAALSLPGIGIHDDFFALGGHSLLAAQLASRLGQELAMHIPMRALFEAPSAAQLATWIETQTKAGSGAGWAIPRRPDRDRAPLSLMQQRLWFMEQLDPGRAVYNTPSAHCLRGKLDEAAFVAAFAEMVRRQEALRTVIAIVDETPAQIILPEVKINLLPATDLRHIPSQNREQLPLDRLKALAGTAFDLGTPPLFRAELFRLDEEEYVFFFMTHHIIWDGWSFDIFYQEMAAIYEAFRNRRPSPLPELPVTYGDFSTWQREWMQGDELAAELAHWKERLAGPIEPLAIPTDHPRPSVMSGNGDTVWISFPASTLEQVRELGSRANATLFMSMLATYILMLHQLTGQREIVVGVPVRGRHVAELESVMGIFVNALPLRVVIAPDITFLQLLQEVRDCVLDAFKHPDVPFDHLVRELNLPRDRSRFPLYQAMFSYQDARQRAERWGNLDHDMIQVMQPGVAEDIGLWILEQSDRLIGGLNYNLDIMSEPTARLLRDRLMYVVDSVLADPEAPISQLAVPEAETRTLASWNVTDAPFDRDALVHSLIETQAQQTPAHVALSCRGHGVSYGELNVSANRIAHALRGRGVRRGQLVGICVERGVDMVAAQLAVLKSGAAYVPLDPAYPRERLSFMAEDANLCMLISESALSTLLDWPRDKTLFVDADAAQIAVQPGTPVAAEGNALPDDPAYVIYTSGSTGKPKGVQVQHRAVVNFLTSMRCEPGLKEGDKLLSVTTLSFDIAVMELLLPLICGAQIVLASREETLDGQALARLLETSQANVMQATPITWRMLLDAGWRSNSGFKALVGGEALPPDLAQRLLGAVAELWNMYGPTETTVWSTCWRVEHPERGIVIGRPIANTQVWILDPSRRLCPIGVAGEIWIGGEGVALGYLGRPELTAERFIPDPFRPGSGARLYRTGDRGRWRADGQLEHLGRLDFQVKIRGYRVELGEIEASVASYPGITQAVAVTREDDPGDVRLAAYFVHDGAAPDFNLLREHVRRSLPLHMVPQYFVPVNSIPLLPNGKIARNALPRPSVAMEATSQSGQTGPLTDTERLLADVWCDLLKIPRVSTSDNFFDLGGHSLLAMQAILVMEGKTGIRITPNRFIFETLGQIAIAYDEAERQPKRQPGVVRRLLSSLAGRGKT